MLRRLFSRRRAIDDALCDAVYGQIVAAARRPALFDAWNAPDSTLGRFEMLALHMILALRRLSGQGKAAERLADDLTTLFFRETDRALRDLGVSDGKTPKQLKQLAEMFYGRARAYGDAIGAKDAEALAAALARNVKPESLGWPEAEALAGHVLAMDAALAARSVEELLGGKFVFVEPGEEQPS